MYKILPLLPFETTDPYSLVSLRQQDLEKIRLWRNAQLEILRQKHLLLPEEQLTYYTQKIFPTFQEEQPSQLLLSFLYQGECIGYGGCTNIEWEAKRAEVSFLLDPSRGNLTYVHELHKFLELLKEVAFSTLKLKKLFTETYSFREEHIATLEKFGFKREGILKNHVFKKGGFYDSYLHALFAT